MLLRSPFDLLSDVERSLALPPASRHLLADVVADDDGVHVSIDVPGVAEDELRLEAEGEVLTVAVERGAQEVHGRVLSRGRMPVSGSLSLRLDRRFDLESVTARLERGVLEVTVPVRSDARLGARRIPISTTRTGELGHSTEDATTEEPDVAREDTPVA